MDRLDREIINRYQGGFPITDRPFLEMAEDLGCDEEEIMARVQRLLDDGTLTRFGPLYDIARMGGAFSLCAMEVPEHRFDEVARQVNELDEVAHNYQRSHRLNMWFVLATETPEGIEAGVERIQQMTGLKVFNFPKLEEYYVGLTFSV